MWLHLIYVRLSIFSTGGTTQWVYLGYLNTLQTGLHLKFEILGCAGYTANIRQSNQCSVHFKTANGGSSVVGKMVNHFLEIVYIIVMIMELLYILESFNLTRLVIYFILFTCRRIFWSVNCRSNWGVIWFYTKPYIQLGGSTRCIDTRYCKLYNSGKMYNLLYL